MKPSNLMQKDINNAKAPEKPANAAEKPKDLAQNAKDEDQNSEFSSFITEQNNILTGIHANNNKEALQAIIDDVWSMNGPDESDLKTIIEQQEKVTTLLKKIIKNDPKEYECWANMNGAYIPKNERVNVIKRICQALILNTTMASVNITHFMLDDVESVKTACKYIAELIKTNKTITSLNLGLNNFSNIGIAIIAEALKDNITLTELNIGWNGIGEDGARAVGESLKHNTGLKTLHIDRNPLGDKGAEALSMGLKENSTLTDLIIERSEISNAGGKALALALTENKTLEELRINDNPLENSGIYFIKALETNTTIERISFYYPGFDSDICAKMKVLFARNAQNRSNSQNPQKLILTSYEKQNKDLNKENKLDKESNKITEKSVEKVVEKTFAKTVEKAKDQTSKTKQLEDEFYQMIKVGESELEEFTVTFHN